jgi:hypothetical protein
MRAAAAVFSPVPDRGHGEERIMERDMQRRVGANEDVFRGVNEGIAAGQWPGEEDEPSRFRCECAQLGCNELITLSMRDYERVRAHPRRFVVVAGHEQLEAEQVVEYGSGYLVVEKIGEAGIVAEELDD